MLGNVPTNFWKKLFSHVREIENFQILPFCTVDSDVEALFLNFENTFFKNRSHRRNTCSSSLIDTHELSGKKISQKAFCIAEFGPPEGRKYHIEVIST